MWKEDFLPRARKSITMVTRALFLAGSLLLAACGGHVSNGPRNATTALNVLVSDGGAMTERAMTVARTTLDRMPVGAGAKDYLYEERIRPAEPSVFLFDPNLYAGALDATSGNLLAAYADAGYPFAEVDDPQVRPRDDWRHVDVFFTVRPGPRLRFGSLRIKGADAMGASLPSLPAGTWYSRVEERRVGNEIYAFFRENGYPMAELSRMVQRRADLADVFIAVNLGDPIDISTVEVVDENGDPLPDDLAPLGVKPGMRYRESTYQAARAHLQRAHPSSDVTFQPEFIGRLELSPPRANGRTLDVLSRPLPFSARLVFVVAKPKR
ncbi:hypothetical protein AKJ09_04448 [Labilithrix luteola]|uniref:Uncharacterized protein n=1 Tax=Labilithrix luteola TaxID=1391654 RepID=A0A0K1PXD1_9BACT|nr:hypothetical protein [Labilithrix luteola]AKU97784.1 hypothetical protein AKJ09_04448 [Labilithrix luteola]